MANVKVGTRTKAGDNEALEAQVKEAADGGAKLVEEGSKKFLVDRQGPITIKRRIA